MQFDWTPMKITNVEVLVLKSPGLYNNPEGSEEPLGPTYMGIVRVSTDAGITGYSDMETVASVAKAAVDAPRWSEAGTECFDGLASLVIGENPLEVERLWYKMYRGSIYYGRRGVAIQAISAIDIALWDIMGKFYQQPVHVLLGGKWRDKVRAYASTLFRPTPEAIREATRKYLDEGFTAIKFGWGVFGKDPNVDVRLVEAARKEMGDQASSQRHPPHVAQYERGKPVQHDTEAPDAVPVLPANASGHDKHTAEHHGAPIDPASMYEGRPSEDRRTPPSEESHS